MLHKIKKNHIKKFFSQSIITKNNICYFQCRYLRPEVIGVSRASAESHVDMNMEDFYQHQQLEVHLHLPHEDKVPVGDTLVTL